MGNEELAQRLTKYRLNRDLSYRRLAQVLGVDVNTIRRIESGRGSPWDRTKAKVDRVISAYEGRHRKHVESEQLP